MPNLTNLAVSQLASIHPARVGQIRNGRVVPPSSSVELVRLAAALGYEGDPADLIEPADRAGQGARMTLAELIASGRATCKIEELQGEVIEAGRCTLYEASEDGGAFADCIIRVGRRKLVALPRLYALLGIPLPDDWLPTGALDERCQSGVVASESDDRRIVLILSTTLTDGPASPLLPPTRPATLQGERPSGPGVA